MPYVYDYNGNVTNEPHKQLGIGYNMLNLPSLINWNGLNRKINYFYTFNGQKLRKTVENNGTITKVDYCGPFVYETVSGTRSLKYIATPYGRAVKNGSAWVYEYNLTDHLGNVRVVIKKGTNGLAEIAQQKGYYSFGMEISQFSAGTGTSKNWYNGKEIQDDFGLYWYDYGARFYDPQLGRWHSVDPKAELGRRWSPYAYGFNNPMRFIDPDGMWPDQVIPYLIRTAAIWFSTTQQKNNESIKSAGQTILRMDPIETKSKGEDIFSFEVGKSFNVKELGTIDIKQKIALNEDKGIVTTGTVGITGGNTFGAKIESSFYQGDGNNTIVESKSDAGIITPSAPSSPIEVNGKAMLRTVSGFIETVTNYCNQKVDEMIHREKYIPNENR